MDDIILRGAIVMVTSMPDKDVVMVAWQAMDPTNEMPANFTIECPARKGAAWCKKTFGFEPKQIIVGDGAVRKDKT